MNSDTNETIFISYITYRNIRIYEYTYITYTNTAIIWTNNDPIHWRIYAALGEMS